MPETSREVIVLLPDDTQFSVPVQVSKSWVHLVMPNGRGSTP